MSKSFFSVVTMVAFSAACTAATEGSVDQSASAFAARAVASAEAPAAADGETRQTVQIAGVSGARDFDIYGYDAVKDERFCSWRFSCSEPTGHGICNSSNGPVPAPVEGGHRGAQDVDLDNACINDALAARLTFEAQCKFDCDR